MAQVYSCVLDDEHLWAAVRYVERNPVRSGLAARAEEYPWSSAGAHVSGKRDGVLDEGLPIRDASAGPGEDWSEWLEIPDDEKTLKRLRIGTHSGRPLGGPAFVSRLERLLDRVLVSIGRGRPRKKSRK